MLKNYNLIDDNLSLTKEIIDYAKANNIYISLKTGNYSKDKDSLSVKRNVPYNIELLKQVYELYIKGECYLDNFYDVFLFNSQPVFYNVLKSNFNKMLNAKETKNLYLNEILVKTKKTNLEKYGVESHFHAKEIQDKITKTNLKKYGVRKPFESKEIQSKIKETNLEKYGVENPMHLSEIQDKIAKTNQERYGSSVTFKSPIIQSKIKQTNLEKYGTENPLSSSIIQSKIEETMIEKYGVRKPFESKEIQDKIKETNLEKYGTENPLSSPIVRNNIKETLLEKYGTDTTFKSPIIQSKIKQTMIEKYGVENPLSSPIIQSKIKETNLERYGVVNPLSSLEIQNKVKETNLEKYGTEHYSQSESYKTHLCQTDKRYAELTNLINKFKSSNNPEDKDNLYNFILDNYSSDSFYKLTKKLKIRDPKCNIPETTIKNLLDELDIKYEIHNREVIKPLELDFYIPEFNIAIEVNGIFWHSSNLKDRDYHIRKFKQCYDNGVKLLSFLDLEILCDFERVKNIIKSNLNMEELKYDVFGNLNYGFYDFNGSIDGIYRNSIAIGNLEYYDCGKIEPNNLYKYFKPIEPFNSFNAFEKIKEFLDELNVNYKINDYNFEFNNLIISIPKLNNLTSYYVSKNFLKEQTDYYNNQSVKVLRFLDVEVFEKFELVKSMIMHNLGLTLNTIYARKCTIKEVSNKEAREFCDKNHLSGHANANIKYGLYYEDKLVQIATFSKHRFKKNNNAYELIRLCSLMNTNVVGGFQKLIKHFKKNFNDVELLSYVDRNISNGNSYNKIGTLLNITEGDLWYVVNNNKVPRSLFMKHNLHKYFPNFPKRDSKEYKDFNAVKFLYDRGIYEYYGSGNYEYLL